MSDEDFHKTLFDANARLIRNYYRNKETGLIKQAKKLYFENDTGFRGFRQT